MLEERFDAEQFEYNTGRMPVIVDLCDSRTSGNSLPQRMTDSLGNCRARVHISTSIALCL
jgi:hypothetical protein